MSIQFRPVSQLVERFGVKLVVYGPPGAGKTPLLLTAPNPCLIATEPGLLSIRKQTIPTYDAFSPQRWQEAVKWLMGSNEVNKYQTVIIDSISQAAELELEIAKKGRNPDPRAHYGAMAVEIMRLLSHLYYLKGPNIVLVAKQHTFDDNTKRPYFPGQDLNVKVPHLFDEILHLDKVFFPVHGEHRVLRCHGTAGIVARDRSGNLAEFEKPDLTELIRKISQ